MSAVVSPNGDVRQLDGRAQPSDAITERDVADAPKLARLLMRIVWDVAALKRRWRPERIIFRDVKVDASGTKRIRLTHKLGTRVEYMVTSWVGSSGAGPADLQVHPDTSDQTLVLVSYVAGTATIRVEGSG